MRDFDPIVLIILGARRERNEKKKAPDSAGKEYDDLLDEGEWLRRKAGNDL